MNANIFHMKSRTWKRNVDIIKSNHFSLITKRVLLSFFYLFNWYAQCKPSLERIKHVSLPKSTWEIIYLHIYAFIYAYTLITTKYCCSAPDWPLHCMVGRYFISMQHPSLSRELVLLLDQWPIIDYGDIIRQLLFLFLFPQTQTSRRAQYENCCQLCSFSCHVRTCNLRSGSSKLRIKFELGEFAIQVPLVM